MGDYYIDEADVEKGIVRFRVVINDACCRPWENMPEVQPPTYSGLRDYLRKVCSIDPRPLAVTSTFGDTGCVLSYGERKQFWLPIKPTPDELAEMERLHALPEHVLCPVCGEEMQFYDEYTMGMHPESYFAAYCSQCDLRMTKNSRMPRLAVDLVQTIEKAAKRRVQMGS